MDKNKKELNGITSVFVAILLWGILPVYWKQLEQVSSQSILANRIIWSFVFVLILIAGQGKLKELFNQLKGGQKYILFLSGIIISLNWFTYIYAVNTNHIIETSLGYYINPLLTILLGRVVLKEKLNRFQVLAVILAAIGVGIMTLSYGRIPVIAMILALTFSLYSLTKKSVNTEETIGLAIETLAVLPIAIGYLLFLKYNGQAIYSALSMKEVIFILGTGVITAIPLMLFSYGARRVPLTTIGFLGYFSPTIALFLGIFIYKEPFTLTHVITFTCIWMALIIYTLSQIKVLKLKKTMPD